MQSEIVNDMQNQTQGSFFGISADEITDVSNLEQLGIAVRYVRNCQVIEKLLEFVQCDDTKGASIAEFIINALNDAGFNPQIYHAETYDGGGNMTGKEKVVAFPKQEAKKPSTFTAHHTNLTYLSLQLSCKL